MITIHSPVRFFYKEKARIEAKIEGLDTGDVLWYETDKKYGAYLTTERSDAFVVGLLWPALKKGEDIVVKGMMSEKLFYSLNYYLIPLLVNMFDEYKHIRLYYDNLNSKVLRSKRAVGTGLSCGVDSLHTIQTHKNNITPPHYKITHLTNFNVGSNHLGGGGRLMRRKFKGRTEIALACAEELEKPLIVVDSNLSEVMKMDFVITNTFRNVSAALIFQKLFHVYYVSSGVQTIHLKFGGDTANYDSISLPLLATENITFYSSGSNVPRLEKTRIVAQMDVAPKYLNVCIHHIHNCGKCSKCKRTLLTLDVLGKIDKFHNVFNLKNFYAVKEDYIKQVIKDRRNNDLYREIYDEMVRTNFLKNR